MQKKNKRHKKKRIKNFKANPKDEEALISGAIAQA
jgi:hypothetical protein